MAGDAPVGIQELKPERGRRFSLALGFERGEVKGWGLPELVQLAMPSQGATARVLPPQRMFVFVGKT